MKTLQNNYSNDDAKCCSARHGSGECRGAICESNQNLFFKWTTMTKSTDVLYNHSYSSTLKLYLHVQLKWSIFVPIATINLKFVYKQLYIRYQEPML